MKLNIKFRAKSLTTELWHEMLLIWLTVLLELIGKREANCPSVLTGLLKVREVSPNRRLKTLEK